MGRVTGGVPEKDQQRFSTGDMIKTEGSEHFSLKPARSITLP